MSNAHAVHSLSSLETDIVVDLGCCSYAKGNRVEDSIQTLVRRFKPALLFGFDPHPSLKEAVGKVYGTTVITSRRAAWTYDGTASLTVNGNCTHVGADEDAAPVDEVQVFDLAAWVRLLPEIDAEGAEYVLLPHLIEHDLMGRFSRVLVEWHTGELANGYESERETILAGIEAPTEEWQ